MYSLVDKQPTTVCSMPITYFLLLWIVHYIFSWYKKELLFLLLGCERGPWICSGVDRRPLSSKNTTDEARTAILLRTEICISGAVKLRPLFQEVTKASYWNNMNNMDTVFLFDTMWLVCWGPNDVVFTDLQSNLFLQNIQHCWKVGLFLERWKLDFFGSIHPKWQLQRYPSPG